MLKIPKSFVAAILIALAIPASSVLAKTVTARPTVVGTVRDAETGEAIAGAAVMIARTGDNADMSAADMQPRVTDAQGRFSMPINARKGAKNEIYVWANWYVPSAVTNVVTGAKNKDVRFELRPEPVAQKEMRLVRVPAKLSTSKDGMTRAIVHVVDAKTGKTRLDLPPTFFGNSLGMPPRQPDAAGRYVFASGLQGGTHRFYLVNYDLRLPEQKNYYQFQVPAGQTAEITISVAGR